MIVEAVKKQVIDVEICPINFTVNMLEQWKVLCRVPINARITDGGYWVKPEHVGHGNYEDVRIRLATVEEKEQFKAFKIIANVAVIL